MLELARFVAVRRYFGILPIRVFPGLHELSSLFFQDLMAVRYPPGWKLGQEFPEQLLLMVFLLLPFLLLLFLLFSSPHLLSFASVAIYHVGGNSLREFDVRLLFSSGFSIGASSMDSVYAILLPLLVSPLVQFQIVSGASALLPSELVLWPKPCLEW